MINSLQIAVTFVIGGQLVDGQIEVQSVKYPDRTMVVGFDDDTIVIAVVSGGNYDVVCEIGDGVKSNFELASLIDSLAIKHLY